MTRTEREKKCQAPSGIICAPSCWTGHWHTWNPLKDSSVSCLRAEWQAETQQSTTRQQTNADWENEKRDCTTINTATNFQQRVFSLTGLCLQFLPYKHAPCLVFENKISFWVPFEKKKSYIMYTIHWLPQCASTNTLPSSGEPLDIAC